MNSFEEFQDSGVGRSSLNIKKDSPKRRFFLKKNVSAYGRLSCS